MRLGLTVSEEQTMSARNRCLATVLLVLFVREVPRCAAPEQTSSPLSFNSSNFQQRELSRREIKERLKRVAEEELHKGNGRLTSDGRSLLNDMLSGAAARVLAVPDVSSDQRERLTKAEQSTRHLILRTLEIAKSQNKGGSQKLIITEDVLKEAWDICPIYPFC
jgi:hypothetical protein